MGSDLGTVQATIQAKSALSTLALLLLTGLAACSQPQAPTFAERVERAEQLERSRPGVEFLMRMMEEHGERINRFVGECYATRTEVQHDTLVVVADIDRSGQFTDVAVQPESEPGRCYADKIAQLKTSAAMPDDFEAPLFPVVLKVTYNK